MLLKLNVITINLIPKLSLISSVFDVGLYNLIKNLKSFYIKSNKIRSCLSVWASHNHFIIRPLMEPVGFKLIKLILTFTHSIFDINLLGFP